MTTILQQGKYKNSYGKVIIIVARTSHPVFWYSSLGFWYEEDGKKALPKVMSKTRPYRDPLSEHKHDLDLSTFTPLTNAELSKLRK